MIAKSVWHINKMDTRIVEEEICPVGDRNILVESKYSFISCGTEALVCSGLVPGELKENMKVNYMGGTFDFPIKYGYSVVGQTKDGRNVHLMHPHQDKFYVREADLFTIPDNLPFKRATLLSNMETAVNAVWDAQLKGNEKVLIVGFGGIGALLAHTVKLYSNINPFVMELDKNRSERAQHFGFSFHEGDFDVIFHTSASNEGLQYAIDHTRKDGTVVELSWYGNRPLSVRLGAYFHYNRVKLISSQVSTVSPFAPVNSYIERKRIACEILLHDVFDRVISNEILIKDVSTYFDRLRTDGSKHALATVIRYS